MQRFKYCNNFEFSSRRFYSERILTDGINLKRDALRRLIPDWAKDPRIAYKAINARAESVDLDFNCLEHEYFP